MDNFSDRTNFQQIRNIVGEQIRLQVQGESKASKSLTVPCHSKIVELAPFQHQPPPESVVKPPSVTQRNVSENKPDTELNFKITGQTFYKVIETLQSRNIQGEQNVSNAQPIYDYIPTDILCVSLKVKSFDNCSSSLSYSSDSDTYVKPEQYDKKLSSPSVNLRKESDLTKVTIIEDYSIGRSKDSHTVRFGSKVYYDKYQNPRIEKRYMSVIGQSEKIETPKHQRAIEEIIQSEYAYVIGLHYIYYNYILFFKEDPSKPLSKMVPFFMMIEKIYLQQSEFYKKLVAYKSLEDVVSHFADNEKLFGLYRNYILNLNTARRHLIVEYRFEILKRQKELDSESSFEDYLLSPLQRLNKYIILLEELGLHLQGKCQLFSKITIILGIFKKLVLTSKSDATIVDSIINRPPTLINFGAFIMRESFYIKKVSPTVKTTVFLFQEIIIFTAPEETGFFAYRHSISMEDLYIRVISDNPISFEVMDFKESRGNEKDLYVLETVDPRTKEIWVEVIESLLWEQLMICKSKVGDKVFKDRLVSFKD